jgi:hypothetical protein
MVLILGTFSGPSQGEAGSDSSGSVDVSDVVRQNGLINIQLWVINVYGFDYATGSYVFDYYVVFYWTDNNITTVNWDMMNGRPSTPTSRQLVVNTTQDDINIQVYRVRADLSTPLEAGNYPFEPVKLPISIEVINPGYRVDLRWMENNSGVDPGFKIVGWKVINAEYTVSEHPYPTGTNSSQATMDVVIQREMFVAIPELIIPPLIFCLVSAFSFLFRMDDSGAFGLRVGLNTSMLITAVLFNLSMQGKIPPTSSLNFYTLFITAVFAFLAINLIITILGYVEFNYHKDPEKLKRLNRYGVIISTMVPILLLIFLLVVLVY